MKKEHLKFEIKSHVCTTDVEIVYKDKKLQVRIVEKYDGKTRVSISGLVFEQSVTIEFITDGKIFNQDLIDEAITLFEKLY